MIFFTRSLLSEHAVLTIPAYSLPKKNDIADDISNDYSDTTTNS